MSDEHADPVARILAEVTDPERMAPGQIEKLRELAALSDDLAVRAHALVALSRLAKPSEQRAIEAVLGALQSEHPVLREAADRALLGWGSRGVPAMLESIRENLSETAYCQHLISIMARIGTDAGAARPLLTHLMNHPKLGPAARAALPHLMPGWGHFGAWIGRQVLDWAIMASLVTVALIVLIEMARPFMADWLQVGAAGQRRLAARLTLLAVAGAGLLVLQVSRKLLHYQAPNKTGWWEDADPLYALPALVVLACLVGFAIYRLETVPNL